MQLHTQLSSRVIATILAQVHHSCTNKGQNVRNYSHRFFSAVDMDYNRQKGKLTTQHHRKKRNVITVMNASAKGKSISEPQIRAIEYQFSQTKKSVMF